MLKWGIHGKSCALPVGVGARGRSINPFSSEGIRINHIACDDICMCCHHILPFRDTCT